MSEPTHEQIVQALRDGARGHMPQEAAVELLIEEEWWLRRLTAEGLVEYTDDPDMLAADGKPMAFIDWVKAAKHPWRASGGERALLQAACSIGSSQVELSLSDVFTSMDKHNAGLVLKWLPWIKR
jgi:hypothetical protein